QRDREGRPAATQQRRMAVLHRGLDIFGVVVPAANDDEIFEPARDEQLTVQLEAQVTGAQERTLPGICPGAREERRECLLRFGRSAPVALRDAAAGVPDFPNLAGRASPPSDRIHDDNLVATLCAAAAYERR